MREPDDSTCRTREERAGQTVRDPQHRSSGREAEDQDRKPDHWRPGRKLTPEANLLQMLAFTPHESISRSNTERGQKLARIDLADNLGRKARTASDLLEISRAEIEPGKGRTHPAAIARRKYDLTGLRLAVAGVSFPGFPQRAGIDEDFATRLQASSQTFQQTLQ